MLCLANETDLATFGHRIDDADVIQ